MLSNVTWLCFFASYVISAALEGTRMLSKNSVSRWGALLFAAAGLVAQTAYLLTRSRAIELPPLLSSGHDWLLVLAWLGVLMYLFVSLLDRSLGFGLFLLPVVVIVVGTARFVSPLQSASLNAQRNWGMLHASTWVLGAAGVVLGLVLSLMYLAQHHRLKHKQSSDGGLELPSLERLSRLNWWAIVVSVPLLTVGVLSGVGLILFDTGPRLVDRLAEPSIIISSLLWAGMMVLFVWVLAQPRSSSRLVAWRTAWACGFLLLTLLVLQVLSRGGMHGMPRDQPVVPGGAAVAGPRSGLILSGGGDEPGSGRP
jgi:ABC-type uncharacterized transport system permease subunit